MIFKVKAIWIFKFDEIQVREEETVKQFKVHVLSRAKGREFESRFHPRENWVNKPLF